MARVDISLNGRIYPIACEDGQENRVREMAAYVDRKFAELRNSGHAATDMHLLAMVTLLVADELFDARAAVQEQEGDGVPSEDPAVLAAVEGLATRVESLAERLERT